MIYSRAGGQAPMLEYLLALAVSEEILSVKACIPHGATAEQYQALVAKEEVDGRRIYEDMLARWRDKRRRQAIEADEQAVGQILAAQPRAGARKRVNPGSPRPGPRPGKTKRHRQNATSSASEGALEDTASSAAADAQSLTEAAVGDNCLGQSQSESFAHSDAALAMEALALPPAASEQVDGHPASAVPQAAELQRPSIAGLPPMAASLDYRRVRAPHKNRCLSNSGGQLQKYKIGTYLESPELCAGIWEILLRAAQAGDAWPPARVQLVDPIISASAIVGSNAVDDLLHPTRTMVADLHQHGEPFLIIIPVHSTEPLHWTVLMISRCDKPQLQILYYDPLPAQAAQSASNALAIAQLFCQWLPGLREALPLALDSADGSRQTDGWSCGLWVLMRIEHAVRMFHGETPQRHRRPS